MFECEPPRAELALVLAFPSVRHLMALERELGCELHLATRPGTMPLSFVFKHVFELFYLRLLTYRINHDILRFAKCDKNNATPTRESRP